MQLLFLVEILPLIFSGLITLISHNSKKILVLAFGENSQLLVGSIGIILHELSHLIIALLFGHKITSVKLLNFNRQDGSLGSVSSTYNPNSFYQKLGNFFIGVAPIYGCFIAILFLVKACFPQVLLNLKAQGVTTALFSGTNFFSAKVILGILVLLSIVLGGFDLSKSDFEGTASGAVSFALLLVVIGFILTLGGVVISETLWIHVIVSFFGIILIISLIGNLLLRLVAFILT